MSGPHLPLLNPNQVDLYADNLHNLGIIYPSNDATGKDSATLSELFGDDPEKFQQVAAVMWRQAGDVIANPSIAWEGGRIGGFELGTLGRRWITACLPSKPPKSVEGYGMHLYAPVGP